MEAKFTPGPWRVCKDENGNTVVATMPEPSDILPGATQSWHLAIVMGTPGKRDKQANANIIASSPLLYEALEAATEAYAYHYGEDCPLTIKCRNALRVARGEK